MLWEAMVAEMRRERTEMDNARHFTPEKQPIQLLRHQLEEWTVLRAAEDPETVAARTSTHMRDAANDDLFEVG